MSDLARNRDRKTLPILFSIIVLDLIGFGIVVPILPLIAKSEQASGTTLGLLLTSYAAMQFVFAPIWGRLSDRIGRRPVMLATVAGSCGSLLLLGLADSLFLLFIARILGGVFGANVSVATAYLSDVTDDDERTRWMGMVGASFGIGFLLGPAIGAGLLPLGYGAPMFFASGLAGINLLFSIFVLVEPERHVSEDETSLSRFEILRSDPTVRRLCTINLFFALAVTQVESFFIYYALDRYGMAELDVVLVMVLMAVVMAVIQGGAMRRLAGRFGEKQLLLTGSFAMLLSFGAIPWMPTVGLLLVPLLASAVGRAISHPSMMSMVSLQASAGMRGAVMGSFQSAASLARTIGPLVAGLLYDANPNQPFLLAAALMIVVLGLGLGLPAGHGVDPNSAAPRS
jgi:DHA1 family tetracycline resistance protein-like MFS transporter